MEELASNYDFISILSCQHKIEKKTPEWTLDTDIKIHFTHIIAAGENCDKKIK